MSGRWASSNRRAELPKDWQSIRQRVLRRDGYRCTYVEDDARCEAEATDVDHTEGRHDHSMKVLRSLCSPHHKRVTQEQAQAARVPLRRPREAHPGVIG